MAGTRKLGKRGKETGDQSTLHCRGAPIDIFYEATEVLLGACDFGMAVVIPQSGSNVECNKVTRGARDDLEDENPVGT